MQRSSISRLCLAMTTVIVLAGCGATPTAVPTAIQTASRSATRAATASAAPQATATAQATATPSAAVATQAAPTATAQAAPPTATATVKSSQTTASASGSAVAEALAKNKSAHNVATSATFDAAKATQITLKGNAVQATGKGVTVTGSTATITASGAYVIQGSLADGRIIVDSKDNDPVKLVLSGVTLSNASGPAIYVKQAKEAVLILADGSQNRIADGKDYAATEDEPNAAIYSAADLTIAGNGSLMVTGNDNDGIASQDGLIIINGAITVTAMDDGIRGKDYVVIKDGRVNVTATGDGLKADNAEDASKGYIYVQNGSINVTSGMDALTAETDILISGGTFKLTSGGGYKARLAQDTSAKGIKGIANVIIEGGAFTIDAADDAVHSNDAIVVSGGSFALATADDGMHADASLKIAGGDIRITSSYEGIESAIITINDGVVHIVSSDDGVNVAAGNDGSGAMPNQGFGGRPGQRPGPGQDQFANTGKNFLYINGGRLVVDAAGDGLDANGAVVMTGGVVIVNGPAMQMNGALDHSGFKMTGGLLVAVGSSGMAQGPDATSTQNALLINVSGALQAGTLIHIQSSDGKEILTFAPTKQYQSLAFSSPSLARGTTYDVYYGGSATGTAQDGLYSGAKYSGGTKLTSFTPSSVVTTIGGRGR